MMEDVNEQPGPLCGQERAVSTTVSLSLTVCSISQDGYRPWAVTFALCNCRFHDYFAVSTY